MKVLAILLIGSMAVSTYAFKCYTCNSVTDSDCDDAYDGVSDHEEDCGDFSLGSYSGCYKTVTKGAGDFVHTIRGCAYGSASSNTMCAAKDAFEFEEGLSAEDDKVTEGTVQYCVCGSDLCNGAVKSATFSVSLLAVFALSTSYLM